MCSTYIRTHMLPLAYTHPRSGEEHSQNTCICKTTLEMSKHTHTANTHTLTRTHTQSRELFTARLLPSTLVDECCWLVKLRFCAEGRAALESTAGLCSLVGKHKYHPRCTKCIQDWLIWGSKPTEVWVVNSPPKGLKDYQRCLYQCFFFSFFFFNFYSIYPDNSRLIGIHTDGRGKRTSTSGGGWRADGAKRRIPLRFQTDLCPESSRALFQSWSQMRKNWFLLAAPTLMKTSLLQACKGAWYFKSESKISVISAF